jgi:hypothetical protein
MPETDTQLLKQGRAHQDNCRGMGWVNLCMAPVCCLVRVYTVTKSEILVPHGSTVNITVLWDVISCSLVQWNVLHPY